MLQYLREIKRNWKWKRRTRKAYARRTKMMELGPYTFSVLADTEFGMFAVAPEDDHVGRQLLRTGRYNAAELELALALLPADRSGSVLMAGVHIGALAVPLSKHCRTLVAIEANPNTIRYLKANLLLNECSNVTLHQLAAGDKHETLKFLMNRVNSGGSKRMPQVSDFVYTYDNPEEVEVPAAPLDSVVQQRNFDLIFMDIEGSEYFALRGMQDILAGSAALIVEFLPHAIRNIAGVDAERFLQTLRPHFKYMYVPRTKRLFDQAGLETELLRMYAAEECHDGLVFLKAPPPRPL